MEITKDMALKELARRELASRGELDSPESVSPSKNVASEIVLNSRKAGVQGALSAIPTSTEEVKDVLRVAGSNVMNYQSANPFMKLGADLVDNTSGFRNQLKEEQFNEVLSPKTDYGKRLGVESVVGQLAQPADDLLRLATNKVAQLEIAKLLKPRLGKVPGALERLESAKAGAKSRQTVSQLLPSADISTDIKMNRPSGVQVEGSNLIKKTSNPQDVVNKFRIEKNRVISQVDNLVTQNNQPVDPNFVGSRAKLILAKDLKNATPKEQADIMKWVKEEGRWIDSQGNFDTVKANARKRYLYQETQGLQKKQNAGKVIVTSPERDKVRDAFSQAYRESIERTHPDIAPLNARFSGLDQGETAASKLVEASIEQQPSNIIQRAVGYTAGRLTPGQGVAAAVRELPQLVQGRSKTVSALTEKIQKSSDLSGDLLARSRELQGDRLLNSFISKNPKTPKMLGVDESLNVANPKFAKKLGVTDMAGEVFERVMAEDAASRIGAQTKKVVDAVSKTKSLPAPMEFEIVPREEAIKRLQEFATKYYSPSKNKIEIPSNITFGGKAKTLLKQMGIDPITGQLKEGKLKSSLQVAINRKTK